MDMLKPRLKATLSVSLKDCFLGNNAATVIYPVVNRITGIPNITLNIVLSKAGTIANI